MNKNTTIIAIVAVIIIGLAVWYFSLSNPEAQIPVTSNDTVEEGSVVHNLPTDGQNTGFAKLGSNAIYVAEQRPGKVIVINIVNLEFPGYVVIHESKDGKPGAVIGASPLISGLEGKNLKITLNREVKDGEELMAMLHSEKSGSGFDATVDIPVLDSLSNAMGMIFQISASAPDPELVEIKF